MGFSRREFISRTRKETCIDLLLSEMKEKEQMEEASLASKTIFELISLCEARVEIERG